MTRRLVLVVLGAAGCILAGRVWALDLKPAVGRPDIVEVGDPVLITRKRLIAEAVRNSDLRDWLRLYGEPDYAEVQEIQFDPPWAQYEVRLYYVDRRIYLAFGRVHVAPSVYDYGVLKYFGAIDRAEFDRLLTAKPAGTKPPPAHPLRPVAPVAVTVETEAVEGVPISE